MVIIVGSGVILVILNHYLRKLLVAAVKRYLPKYAKYFEKKETVDQIPISKVTDIQEERQIKLVNIFLSQPTFRKAQTMTS